MERIVFLFGKFHIIYLISMISFLLNLYNRTNQYNEESRFKEFFPPDSNLAEPLEKKE